MQNKIFFPASIKEVGEEGVFKGYANVFDVVDSQRDVVERGAFTKSLQAIASKQQPLRLLWQHDTREPIGILPVVKEDNYGLYVEGKLNLQKRRGQEAYSDLKTGAIRDMSIGFMTKTDGWDKENMVRRIKEAELFEVSLVTFPANEYAQVTSVKNNQTPQTVREFEEFLRDAGYSRKEAATIASNGFKALPGLRDSASEIDAFSTSITKAMNILKG